MNQDSPPRSANVDIAMPVVDMKTKTPETSSDMQVLDAKMAIVLVQFSRMRTKNEYHQWLLKHIGIPLSVKSYGNIKVLYLSEDAEKIWSKEHAKSEKGDHLTLLTSRDHSPLSSPGQERQKPKYYDPNLYMLSPYTRILSISTEYRMVFMVDMSASLAALDPETGTVLISQVLEKLENCLDGIARPFSFRISEGTVLEVKPKIRISVIAECSQFASNINLIPLLSDHPTMKVFLQNVVITTSNLPQVLIRLRSEFNNFQTEYVSFRKSLTHRRAKLDYDLDVSTEHSVRQDGALNDTQPTSNMPSPIEQPTSDAEPPSNISTPATVTDPLEGKGTVQDSFYGKLSQNKNNSRSHEDTDQSAVNKGPTQSQAKKEVWGLGRTGANLTYLLYACHLALKLLPQDGRPSVVLITDGVVKSSLQDESVIRLFAEDDIPCNIIQVGSGHRFAPTANFGFVPDDDILHYVVDTTGGQFMSAEECQPIKESIREYTPTPSERDDERLSEGGSIGEGSYFPPTHLAEQLNSKLSDLSHPVVRYLSHQESQHPNFYHNRLIVYERSLKKRKSEAKKSHAAGSSVTWSKKMTGSQGLHHDHHDRQETTVQRNFPWDPMSRPLEPVTRLLKYHEYALPTEFSHIVAARTRQGFIIRSITISNASKAIPRGNGRHDDPVSICKEHIQLLMTLDWQPNVTIEYRIHASWFPPAMGTIVSSNFLSDSGSPSSGSPVSISIDGRNVMIPGGIFSRARAPRVEIFVKTHTAYAHMLQNWDVFTRRMQMLGVVTGSIAPGDARAAPIYAKLGRLRQALDQIRELDEVLRSVVTFNARQLASLTARQHNRTQPMELQLTRLQQYEIYVNSFKSFWESINKHELRYQMRCFYDHGSVDFLISNISPYMSPRLMSTYNQDYVHNVEAEISFGLSKIKSLLSSWSTFVGTDGTFVKLVHRSTSSQTPFENQRSPRHSGIPPSDSPALSLSSSSTAFCEIRLWREIGCLVTLHVVYYNVDVVARQDVLHDLRSLISTANRVDGPGSYVICKRPLSTLLMRDSEHLNEADSFTHIPNLLMPLQQGDKFSERHWYMPSALWLNGQYIVRNHLRHMTWSWNTNNDHDDYHRENKMMPLSDLAFQFLCHARLNQGYQLVLPRQDRTHFYKENLTGSADSQACAIQYFIWKDSKSGSITTELWMEPAETPSLQDQYSYVKDDTFEFDKTCLSQLVTFDQIHAVGRLKAVAEISDSNAERGLAENANSHKPVQTMSLSTIFDLTAALRLGTILMPLYKCPRFLNENASLCSSPGSWQNSGSVTPEPQLSPAEELSGSTFLEEPSGPRPRPLSRPVLSTASPSSRVKDISKDADPGFEKHTTVSSYINQYKEQFIKLSETNQDYVLLHASVESSISNEINGEILLSQHDSSKDFWNKIISSMAMPSNESCVESSMSLVEDLRGMRCFVRVLNPRSFIVILIPKLPTVIRGMLNNQDPDHSPVSARARDGYDLNLQVTVEHRLMALKETSYVPVLMFECVRQRPLRPDSTAEHSPFASVPNQDGLSSLLNEPLELTITNIVSSEQSNDTFDIRPVVYQGKFSSSLTELSNHSFKLQNHIDHIYAKSFMKSMYSCMLQGRSVDEQDMERMMKIFRQDYIKVDITEFLNARSLLHQQGEDSETAEIDIQHRFLSVLNYYLEPVRTAGSGPFDLYYFRPPMTFLTRSGHRRTSTLSISHGSNLDRLTSYSEHPLLVRLECVYHKQTDAELPEGPKTQIHQIIPVSELPTSYGSLSKTSQNFDYEPHGIGCDQSPVASRDGTRAELRLVCLTLPNLLTDEQAAVDTDSDHLSKHDQESEDDQTQDTSELWKLSNISEYQKIALAETEARLSWFLKEEVMHSLLLLPSVTELTLKYIEAQLIKKNPFVDFPTSIVLPLSFVRNNKRTREVFLDELERDESGYHRFARVGNYFYVKSKPDPEESALHQSVTSLNPADEQDPNTVNLNEDFCHGLGISVLTEDQHSELEREALQSRNDNLHFWLILLPRQNDVQVYFYSKHHLSNRSDIIRGVKQQTQEIQEKVNRLVLLQELNETRICSKYLEVPEDEDEDNNLSEDNSDDTESGSSSQDASDEMPSSKTLQPLTVQIQMFQPGQFACPLLYTKKFPLHWRIPINGAFKSLATETLRMFAVKNKTHMFVIEREGTVVYCKLYEESVGDVKYLLSKLKDVRTPSSAGAPSIMHSTPTSTVSSSVKDSHTPITPTSIQRSRSQMIDPNPSAETELSSMKAKSQEERRLVLDVYGVELPRWIEDELVNMVENRLLFHITLREIQQFLIRNPSSKLTSADVDYLLPVKKPSNKQILRVPTLVANPLSLLELVKQSILATESFYQMAPSEVKDAVLSHYHTCRQAVREDAQHCRRDSRAVAFKSVMTAPISEYCFYYNCAKRSPTSSTPIEMEAGQGLAGVCIMLLDSTCKPVASVPVYEDDTLDQTDVDYLKLVLDDEFRDASVRTSDYHIMIEIWSYGQCDADILQKHIWRCYGQSICHYIIRELSDTAEGMRRSDVLSQAQRLHTMNHNSHFDKIFLALQYAVEWGSNIISSLTKHVSLPPWSIDDILAQSSREIENVTLQSPSLMIHRSSDTVGRTKPQQRLPWTLHNVKHHLQQVVREADEFVILNGLLDRITISSAPTLEPVDRRGSHESERSGKSWNERHSRRGSTDSAVMERSTKSVKDEVARRQIMANISTSKSEDVASTSQRKLSTSSATQKQLVDTLQSYKKKCLNTISKYCFVVMKVDTTKLSIYMFNWPSSVSNSVLKTLYRIVISQESRAQMLSNILHQKMGLFHHSLPFKNILEPLYTTPKQFIPRSPKSGGTSNSSRATPPTAHIRLVESKLKSPSPRLAEQRDKTVTLDALTDLVFLSGSSTAFPLPSESGNTQTSEKNQEKVHTAARVLQPNNILRDVVAETSDAIIGTKSGDPLLRHAQPFLETYLRQSRIRSAHEKAFKVYTKWASRCVDLSNLTSMETISPADLRIIMGSARLLHFCRTPLVFAHMNGTKDKEEDNIAPRIDYSSQSASKWYTNLARTLMKEYAAYLESVGMHVISFNLQGSSGSSRDDGHRRTPSGTESEDVPIEYPTVYLLKVFEGGSVLCQVRVDEGFVSVTLYTLHRRYGRLSLWAYDYEGREIKRQRFKAFTEECDNFKTLIHVNSFIFDFHLRYIQRTLIDPDTLASSINLLGVIRKFERIYTNPVSYSRNRIVSGYIQVNMDISCENLLSAAYRHANKFGCETLHHEHKPVACFVNSNDPYFTGNTVSTSAFQFSLILCSLDKDDPQYESSTLRLRYFVIVTYDDAGMACESPKTIPTKILKQHPAIGHVDPLDEVLAPEIGLTLGQVVRGARAKIDTIISKLIHYYRRDLDWSRIYEHMEDYTYQDIIPILKQFDAVDLIHTEPNFARYMTMKLPWDKIFDVIGKCYCNGVRKMEHNGEKHLLLFNARYMDYFMYFRWANDVTVQMVSREPRNHSLEPAEKQQITEIGTLIGYTLWRCL